MAKQTPLYSIHADHGARLVDFGGWDMPLHYGSQLDEHHAVRGKAGIFDVSHMTIADVEGEGAEAFLRYLLANDVRRLDAPGKALYSCMLTDDGGVVDDLIVYRRDGNRFRLVVNAATRDKDLAWIDRRASGHDVTVVEQTDLAMVAVQGPEARALTGPHLPATLQSAAAALKPFSAVEAGDWFVARTGYTGEDGFEIVLPGDEAAAFWRALEDSGVAPCGLGARDTLRLEAGMNLYGTDMDESCSPLESGLSWTVAWQPDDRDFVGRGALEAARAGDSRRRFVGLLLEDRGVLRNGQRIVVEGIGEGEITSGGFSPTMQRSIALARLPAGDYSQAQVDMRGKLRAVTIVKPPFVRKGEVLVGG